MIEIVYEDDALVVVNKPNNLLVHHSHFARNIREDSLAQLLRKQLDSKVFPIHRLDRKTSGLIMFGKKPEAIKYYQAQLEGQQITKTYVALVRGYIPDSGIVDSPIRSEGKSDYKDALTTYQCIEKAESNFPVDRFDRARYSLVELLPKTGRTHQLRKHMNKIAHPIIGDPKYGDRHHNHEFERRFGHTFLFLHAQKLEFTTYSTKELVSIKASYPEFWEDDLRKLGFNYKPNL